jgi:hypothetical protein
MNFCNREKLSLIANPSSDWRTAHLTVPEFLLSFSRYRLLIAISPADFPVIRDFCQTRTIDCQLIATKLRSGLNHFFIEGFADCGLDQIQAWTDREQ